MREKRITTSAPATIMITGEHAVVYGYPAIVAAIEYRLSVCLRQTNDGQLRIYSQLGDYSAPMLALSPSAVHRVVLLAIEAFLPEFRAGLTLSIHSDINTTQGHGSSAALTIATLAALTLASGKTIDYPSLHTQALMLTRNLQGLASGADLAAALYGGLIGYALNETAPATVIPLPKPPALLSLCYSGYKTPTAQVLALVADKMRKKPDIYQMLYQDMGSLSQQSITYAQAQNWQGFYASLNAYHPLMQQLCVSDVKLDALIAQARACSATLASKISGSGLGDSILCFTDAPNHTHDSYRLPNTQHQPVFITQTGLIHHIL